MKISTNISFSLPSKAVAEAVLDLQKSIGRSVMLHEYTASAVVLLEALVEMGWTVFPPDELR